MTTKAQVPKIITQVSKPLKIFPNIQTEKHNTVDPQSLEVIGTETTSDNLQLMLKHQKLIKYYK